MSKDGRRVRIFSALEVANSCGVVNQTAINWIRSGHLKAFTTPGGHYRIYAKDLAAFLDKRGMSPSGEVLQVMMENANWNVFMIAMEQFTNDSLKPEIESLFPGYTIIQAYDWFEIGRKLTEEKPGFVLLDAELPGVDISKFVHTINGYPFFGRPCVFLLTNGDSSAQVDAPVRADMVLAKPLDPGKLRTAVDGFERQIGAAITA
jgi:excisionase family DNA binding protein